MRVALAVGNRRSDTFVGEIAVYVEINRIVKFPYSGRILALYSRLMVSRSPPGIAITPAGFCFTDVTFFF